MPGFENAPRRKKRKVVNGEERAQGERILELSSNIWECLLSGTDPTNNLEHLDKLMDQNSVQVEKCKVLQPRRYF